MEKGLTAISDEEPKLRSRHCLPPLNTTKKRFTNARDGYIGSARHSLGEGDMAEGFVHTLHINGRWVNSLEGRERRILGTFDTKEEAVEAGREEASRRLTEQLIHNEDLSVEERNSYRADRRPPQPPREKP